MSDLRRDKTLAHCLPLFLFLGIMLVPMALEYTGFIWRHTDAPWYRRSPEQWAYPVQTLLGLGVLAYFWPNYQFQPVRGLFLATALALLGIFLWILPGHLFWKYEMSEGWWKWFGFTSRDGKALGDGFNPEFIQEPLWYWSAIGMRFLRMVVVVALVEEIFWRGFLMRFLLDPDGNYWKQPFGKPSWRTFFVVTGLFMVAHAPSDYLGALIYGSLTYLVAVKTKSLFACVWMHGVANLSLGIYVMVTRQYGYW